jgi:peptidoglycan/xylan/chitin deacetylase (PgdA/CDA1 family)
MTAYSLLREARASAAFAPALAVLALTGAMTAGAANAAGCGPDALGVSRTVKLSAQGGLKIGLKSYPRTLALADHEVVLTFDDGPAAGATTKVLDALAAECVKATFFLIGRNAQALPGLVRREVAEGHTVAHHTFSHPAATMRRLSESAAKTDIDKGFAADDQAAYGSASSEPRVKFFRFPGFADTPELDAWLASRNIGIFGADVWASDWLPMSSKTELALVLSRLEQTKGGILLMHDSKAQTAAMLPDLLRELKQRGFHIAHIEPGDDPPSLRPAPPGWTSETEKIIEQIFAREAAQKNSGAKTAPRPAPQAAPAAE